jgi:hypothetical protein
MIEKENFYIYQLTEKDKSYCLEHAKKMCDGFQTYSFKNNITQSEDVYNIGKIGELVLYKFIKEFGNKKIIKIPHVPFRESYDKINFNDDFIIDIENKLIQLEVKTKCRNVEPELYYECCIDCIKPHLIYIFLSYNRKTDIVSLLGFADWSNLKLHANPILKGNENVNFKHKANEFDIQIQYLNNINTLIEHCKSI